MHSIPNYYRKNDKMATNITTNTIPVRMAIHTSLQAINVGESQQVREPPYTVGGNAHWQQSLEKTASACQNTNISRELSLVYDIHTWTYIPRNLSFKKTHAPQYSIAKIQNDKMSSNRLKLKDMW